VAVASAGHTEQEYEMQTRRIGGLEVSVVGLGCNNFGARLDRAATAHVVHAAVDVGITFFDTADSYGEGASEEFLGAALAGLRDDVVIATKFGWSAPEPTLTGPRLTGGDPAWVRTAVDDSLRRLGTDRIDLYQFHRPDPEVRVADTLGALHELVVAGKVIEIGCSNFDADLLEDAYDGAASIDGTPFASVQNHYSVLNREIEIEVMGWCVEHGTAVIPFFPLESGLLTGKVTGSGEPPAGSRLAAMTPDRRDRFLGAGRVEAAVRLQDLARSHDRSLLELAFGYLLAQPPVASVIAGATSVEQVAANVAAAGWQLSADEVGEIREVAAVRSAGEGGAPGDGSSVER
jgi:aryl-alcohol dehydrogenase-like predicted oxidoreductase